MGSIPIPRGFKANSVAILGAGSSGIAAAKYLLAENVFSSIKIFEQRSAVGGLWNYAPCESASGEISIPQTSPHAGLQRPIWGSKSSSLTSEEDPTFISPVYDRLETNIPRGLMGFSDLPWLSETQLFPKHPQVLSYLQTYSKDVLHLITFNTQVLSVQQTPTGTWKVTTQHISKSSPPEPQEETFDAVIVANGHYDVPKLPSVPGIEAFDQTYPNIITHSKFYRSPEVYAGKKVIIVGNSASGIDIGAQISQCCSLPLLQSQKSESYLAVPGTVNPSIVEKPGITEYILQDRSVKFADGTIESGVDAIVYCTGYFYSFPLLEELDPPVIRTGERVENLYRHIFYQHNPSLAFLALNQKVIPFPWAQAQAAVVARVFSGRLSLPSVDEMKAWEEELVRETGEGTAFHILKFPKDAEAINAMAEWAESADGKGGKEPVRWGEEECWVRERFPRIKKAFMDLGEERGKARELRDVGFDFSAGKEGQ